MVPALALVNQVADYAHNSHDDDDHNSSFKGQFHMDSPPALEGTTYEGHHTAKPYDADPQDDRRHRQDFGS